MRSISAIPASLIARRQAAASALEPAHDLEQVARSSSPRRRPRAPRFAAVRSVLPRPGPLSASRSGVRETWSISQSRRSGLVHPAGLTLDDNIRNLSRTSCAATPRDGRGRPSGPRHAFGPRRPFAICHQSDSPTRRRPTRSIRTWMPFPLADCTTSPHWP